MIVHCIAGSSHMHLQQQQHSSSGGRMAACRQRRGGMAACRAAVEAPPKTAAPVPSRSPASTGAVRCASAYFSS
jgi:hypothetical protein